MSPVNEGFEPELPVKEPIASQVVIASRNAIGATNTMPARIIVLFTVAIACSTLAPLPINIVGVAAIVLLAIDAAAHRR
jgi:hypothetical protein